MREVKIYGLVDPETDEIRYVGKTVKTLSSRLSNHVYNAKVTKHNRHLSNWFLKFLNKGLKPLIIELEKATEENWKEIEMKWIKKLPNLINLTEGGDGSLGYCHSPESVEKIRKAKKGFKHSKETKEKTSEFFKNIERTESWRNSISKALKGRKASKKARKNLSEAHKGYIMPEEQKEKIRKALKGRKRPPEVIAKIKASHIKRVNNK